jgi:hypothetical protein
VLYVVIIVHKFDLSLVINENKKLGYAVIETRVFERNLYVLPPTVVASVKGPYPRRAVSYVLLNKTH